MSATRTVGAGGDFTTIQAAVDAAVNGDTIVVAPGTYTEDVTITSKSITLDGVRTGGVNDVTLNGQITVAGVLDGALSITDLNINASGKTYGVFVSAASTGFAGSVTLDDMAISNAQQNGFAYIRAGNGSTPTRGDTIGAVSILNSEFSNNATVNAGSNGRGDILLFGYNQDLTITNVDISSPGAFAQKAIQMRGIQDGGDVVNTGPYDPAGDVAINNLTITGAYAQDIIAFYRIADFDSFTGSNNSVNVTRSANASSNATLEPWAVINMDEVGGTVDLSSFFSSASNLASPDGVVPAGQSWIATLQGLTSSDTFTGTAGSDTLIGRDGADILRGGVGNDTIIGGAGIDTAAYSGLLTAANLAAVVDADPATAGNQAGWQVSAGAEGTDLLNGVEKVSDGAGHHFLLVGNGGYATIQAAVDAAAAGDTIVVGAGIFAGATISKELTIVGQGAGQTIITTGSSQYGFDVTGNVDASAGDGQATVTIQGFTFTGNSVGVHVSSTALLDHLVVQNSDFAGNNIHGIGTGSGAFGLDAIDIVNSTFEQNGNGSQNGDGDIVLFGFTGDALIKNVTIAGGANAVPTNANADTGIQINGRDPGSYDVTQPIGNVVFDNVSVPEATPRCWSISRDTPISTG